MVLTLDLIRFGEVLSSYGPEAFDDTARLFAERIREQLPHRGFAARFALDRLQGFLLARPLPFESVLAAL